MAFIEKIKLQNFKSHTLFEKDIPSNNIVIHGNNGIGKTNLLESLSFFSNSKGMRTNKLENFLQKQNNIQSEFAQAECQLKQSNYSTNISYKIHKQDDQINKIFLLIVKKALTCKLPIWLILFGFLLTWIKLCTRKEVLKRNLLIKLFQI